MELTSPTAIKDLLYKHEAKASKGLGQNFLIDQHILDKIIEAADIKPDDVVLEVGPGLGTLTQRLAQKAKQVVAVEKDETMIKILEETLKDYNNVEVLRGDILEQDFKLPKNYKVVANIPYYITAPLIRALLENENQPSEIVLMLQKEVAQRICSKPPSMSLLAVSVQFYAEPKIVSYVSKNCFWPAPKIDSAIIKIVPFGAGQGRAKISANEFFKVVKAGFIQPRKQLVNNLTTLKFVDGVKLDNLIVRQQISSWLLKNSIKPNQRAETLSVSDWINLTKSLENFNA